MEEKIEFYRETEFKDTEIGRIPREWEVMVAADVADYINGYPFSPADWKMHGVPIIRIQNLNDPNAEFNCFDGKVDDIYKIRNGDLLFSWSASIGIHIWKGGDAVLNQHIFKVVPKANINKLFLYYDLLLAIEQLKSRVHGSTMKHFQKNELKTIFMPIPPLPEQQKIAEIISTIDEAIQKTDEVIAKTESLKKGLMQELLTKGIGHREFKDTEIGKIPKDWEMTTLGEISSKITDGTHITPRYVPRGVPFISTKNIVPFKPGFDFQSYEKYISEEEHAELSKRCKPEKGDLLISKCGTIGRTKLIDVDYEFSIFVGLALIKLKNKEMGPFLEQLLNYKPYVKRMELASPGATRKTLTIDALEDLIIPIPPLPEQQKIAEILSTVDKKLEASKLEKAKLEKIKQWFMEELLSGRIRVRVA